MNNLQKVAIATAAALAIGATSTYAFDAEAQELKPNSRTDRYFENYQDRPDRRGNPYAPDFDRGWGAERYYYNRIQPPYDDENNRYLYPREQFEQARNIWRYQREQCIESGYRDANACRVYESGRVPTAPVLVYDPVTRRSFWQHQGVDPRGGRFGLETDNNAGGREYQDFLRERDEWLDRRRERFEDRRGYRRGPRYE